MRHFFKYNCIIGCIASLLWCSGCMRIHRELHPEPPYLKPREKVFSGSHEFTHSLVFIPIFYWPEILLEVLADVVFLPIDGVRCAYYVYNQPLGQIVQDNDLENLKKHLEKGENPNQVDMRFAREPPITFAHSLEAVQLLCEHGAKITPGFLFRCLWQDKAILHYIIQNHLYQEMASPSHNSTIVDQAVMALLNRNRNESLFQDDFEKVSMLLQSGFSPNTVSDYQYRKTALDWVQESVSLRPSEKEALIKLLKQYGAVTYCKAARQSSAFPRFMADNYDLNPIFTRAEKFLYESRNTKYFVVSTTCPGVSGPVLVIDRLPWDYDYNKTDSTTRTTVMVHRRETPVAWRQESEQFEIPVVCRMVLTPPGTKMPSRIKGKYLQNIISEQWYSMDDFEVYEEINCQYYAKNLHRINELRALTRTQQTLPIVDAQAIPKPMGAYCFAENLRLCNQDWPYYPETDLDKFNDSGYWQDFGRRFLQRAHETFEREQFTGRWFVKRGFHNYCFSTHRSAIPENVKDIMPHPSEILVTIILDTSVGQEARYVYDNSHKDLAYWNWIKRVINDKAEVKILYGDDVSEERLQQIEALAVGLIE